MLLLLAGIFSVLKLPDLNASAKRVAREERKKLSLWGHRNLVWGVPAIFMCLICEIGVGSLFINFVKLPEIGNMTAADAGGWPLTALWGGMAVGRFIGAWLMTFIEAESVLAGAAIGAFTVLLTVVFASGPLAMYAGRWRGCKAGSRTCTGCRYRSSIPPLPSSSCCGTRYAAAAPPGPSR